MRYLESVHLDDYQKSVKEIERLQKWQEEALVALQTAKNALGDCPEKGQIKIAREVVDALLDEVS